LATTGLPARPEIVLRREAEGATAA